MSIGMDGGHAIIALPLTLKATPRLEGGERWLYCEPSNEATDLDGERMLRAALRESRQYFLDKGNFDLDHITIKGYQPSIPNPRLYEIGRPTDVRFDDERLFVKGYVYRGDGPTAERANEFWDSLTQLAPPMPWYPSVGGYVRDAGTILPTGEAAPVKAIKRVYWNNIGFAREPVNPTVPGASLVPLGVFAKCWIGPGSTLAYTRVAKASEAGYGTELAQLRDGGALRTESLHGAPTRPVRQDALVRLLRALQAGEIHPTTRRLHATDLIAHLRERMGLDLDDATATVRQFLSTLTQSTTKGATV